MVDVPDYGWLSEGLSSGGLGEAACVTAVVGRSARELLQDFGSDGTERIGMSDVFAGHPRSTVSLVDGAVGVVAVEVNGFQGSREEVLRPASEAGKAASVYWGVNGNARFACARKGRMVCDLDLLLDDDANGLPASLRSLLPDDRLEANLEAVGMSMVEAFTGVPVTRQMVVGLDFAFALHPVLDALEEETADSTTLVYDHPEVVEQIGAIGPTTCRHIAEWAALKSVRHVGLENDTRVRSITSQFGRDVPAEPTADLIQLAVQFNREADLAHAADEAREPDEWGLVEVGPSRAREKCWQNDWAALALRHSCVTNPTSAALGAVNSASVCLAIDDLEGQFFAELTRTFGLDLPS